MFGRPITLFRLLGFEVRLDLSWIILGVLVMWSLAEGLFPYYFPGASTRVYWAMGFAGTIGLVLSIVLHEFSHSLVARRYGLPIKGITLFIFGGVAEMTDEPPSAKAEFLMAFAGPLSSLVIAAVAFWAYSLGANAGFYAPAVAVVYYLGYLNLILAIFNLVPAFPLDGGRMLRAALWGWRKDLKWATRVAAAAGGAFGLLLIFFGVLFFLSGNLIGGIWWVLIGLFLRGAAAGSYRQMLLRQDIAGKPVRNFMTTSPVTIGRSLSVRDWVQDYVYRYHHKMYPVVEEGELVGCVDTTAIKNLSPSEWAQHSVDELSRSCDETNTVSPDADAGKALAKMTSSGNSRLIVVDQGKLVGIITLKDMLDYLSLKHELEE